MSNSFADFDLSTPSLRRSGRLALGVALTVLAAACSGSQSPTAPTSQASASQPTAAAAAPSSGVVATEAAAQQDGSAYFILFQTGTQNPCTFSGESCEFAMGSEDGQTGRLVPLGGDIMGINFEPGVCADGVDMNLGFPTRCVVFGDGPGQFTRLHAGGTGFTNCHCSVGGIGDPNTDNVTLKISYPPSKDPKYPNGFTKFAFQDPSSGLAGLSGQGTLDFASFPQVSFKYHFATHP